MTDPRRSCVTDTFKVKQQRINEEFSVSSARRERRLAYETLVPGERMLSALRHHKNPCHAKNGNVEMNLESL